MLQCRAVFLANGVGKGVITDEYVRDAMKRSKSKVARVSECTMKQAEKVAGTVIAGAPTDTEELSKESERRYSTLCRRILHGIYSSGPSTQGQL